MTPAGLRYGAPLAVGFALLAAWQAAVMAYDVPSYLVPSPLAVLATLQRDWGLLSRSLAFTLAVTLSALLLATLIGVATAFLFVQSRVIEASLFPYAVLLQVTPIVAVAPLIIIWVRDTRVALVICATIVALFPVVSNTTLGLRSVDPALLELFRLYRAGRWQTLVRLRVPTALPYFFAGLRVSAGLALIGAVVAEFVAGTGGTVSGLAYQILISGLQLNIPRLFAALFLIAATGIVLSLLTALAARLALRRWHESELT
ncbi:MAG TPA: ABC transporter permease [Casimicrobiaceae bacterium]|nr:ABC transporter permease [Casimicrobiaceae bacterium]